MNSMQRLAIGCIAVSALFASHAMAQSTAADRLFAQMDTNHDGKISEAEYVAFAKARFDRMDKNKTGKIVIADFYKEPNKPSRGQATAEAETAVAMLRAMDLNGDGIITAEENVQAAKARFEKMDTNKDGFLSKAEWTAGRAAMMKHPSK